MDKQVKIWKPIQFDRKKWLLTNTSKLDDLSPSWFRKRKELIENAEQYGAFMGRLKRQHAIETGIIEKLYDLKEGVTETLIKEGFIESYLQHGDTNIAPKKLFAYLDDHLQAMDFVFDVVNRTRPLSRGFISELHRLVTQHQDTTEAIDSLGRNVNVELLKGQFKKHDNNPKRKDGTTFLYCSYIQAESEVDNLVRIFSELEQEEVKPVVLAAWFHHAFTQIHPFQDGNGRVVRLLASLILIRHRLFPLTVNRIDRKTYIDALEQADKGEPQPLVGFFCELQRQNIEEALNLGLDTSSKKSLSELAGAFSRKVRQKDGLEGIDVDIDFETIKQKRIEIFLYCKAVLGEILTELSVSIPSEVAEIKGHFISSGTIDKAVDDSDNNHRFGKNFPISSYSMDFITSELGVYEIYICIAHYGKGGYAVSINPMLSHRLNSASTYNERKLISVTKDGKWINIKPHIISIETDMLSLQPGIKSYLQDAVAIAMAQIIDDIG